ncbi:Fanconi anemia group J protein homolog isoform X3 [Varroa destructor]|uniref:DNA 5'-3' helicase n=1 Tax=Varroa destructor TaxID=109461 RepID=A0A7M7KHT4_VARDE|nr:Fanconi anemia group J protein homolog isoform X3 [Varroa destructor]
MISRHGKISHMKQYTHPLAGIRVRFPYEHPYPQQRVIMCRLITALKQHKNCLIECPTGTGKTLSLLCGALSFVEEQKRLREEAAKKLCSSSSLTSAAHDHSALHMGYTPTSNEDVAGTVLDMYEDLEKQDEVRGIVKIHAPSSRKSLLNDSSKVTGVLKAKLKGLAIEDKRNADQLPKVPKIFYGTRTHRQVSQVVAEFNRTDYGKMRMTILGSRDRMCINKKILRRGHGESGEVSVNEECRALMKLARQDQGCIFYSQLQKVPRSVYPTLFGQGLGDPWDIEDLKGVGQERTLCPYYWSVQLAETADITFCPYNYILDPTVRKAVQINLSGNIVILDEAHNIEDICRDSMELELNLSDVLYIEEFIETALRNGKESRAMAQVLPTVGALKHVLLNESAAATLTKPQVFDHEKLCGTLEIAQVGPMTWSRTKKIVEELLNADDDISSPATDSGKTSEGIQDLDARCKSVFGALANTLEHLYKMDMKYTSCFRAAVLKKIPKDKHKELSGKPEVTLNIYCLNSAVGLVDIKDTLHSLVIASGTLSPMKSIQCELDVPFPISISLNHVVAEGQIFACVSTRGPERVELKCDYKNSMGFTLQDDLGRALVQICSRIPNGVLCFFPSYSTMKRMCERWQITGTWSKMEQLKRVFVEGQSKLPEMMREYYEESLTPQGALLMAVCRGGVSEGEDFPDKFARAVVIIGLPFPNIKDITIKDKMAFNDRRHRQGEDVMTGQDWYSAQAFRALNQALGRCIRHSNDWGAIILLDSRVSYNARYKDMLCRWVRDRIVEVNDFNALDNRLGEFVLERRVENEMGDTSHSRNLESSCTERELTKLQSGLGLSRSKNVCLSDLNSSSSGSETPPKQTYKMFPIFQLKRKRRSCESSATDRRAVGETSACSNRDFEMLEINSQIRSGPFEVARLNDSKMPRLSITSIVIEDSPAKYPVSAASSASGSITSKTSNESEVDNDDDVYITQRHSRTNEATKMRIATQNDGVDDENSSDLFSD